MSSSPLHDQESDDDGSSGDDPLFKFQSRGAFKRKREQEDDEDDGAKSGEKDSDEHSSSDDEDEDDGGGGFDSSPDLSGRQGGVFGDLRHRIRLAGCSMDTSSDDEAECKEACPPEREVLDDAAMQEIARREADELIASCANASGSLGVARDNAYEANKQFNRKVRADLEAASRFDSPDLVPGAAASAAARSPSVMRKLAERERERRAKKLLKLKVTRGRRVHIFNTRLGREIQLILNACRKELLDDNEQGAELSLLCQGQVLDSSKTLIDAGLMGDADLVLEVKGEELAFSGPPITLKIRVEDSKTFTVEATKDMNFSVLVESFCQAVGVPGGRTSEAVLTFDGDRLSPEETPEDVDMEDEDLIDARLPTDLLQGVQSSPSELKLVGKPKPKKAAAATGSPSIPSGDGICARGGSAASESVAVSKAAEPSAVELGTTARRAMPFPTNEVIIVD